MNDSHFDPPAADQGREEARSPERQEDAKSPRLQEGEGYPATVLEILLES